MPRAFAVAVLAVSVACRPDSIQAPTESDLGKPNAAVTSGCGGSEKPGGSAEGEVFGSVFQNGEPSCQTWGVSLIPYADAQSHLHMPTYKSFLIADPRWANMWEYWDPLAGGPCTPTNLSLSYYVANGSDRAEVAHASPSAQEGHCVRPGRYLFELGSRSFDVDYIQPAGRMVLNTGTGVSESVENTGYSGAQDAWWQDLVIHVDFTTVHPGDTPVLEIQNAGADPYGGAFADDPAPSGTAEDWFRFSVMKSTSGWQIDTRGPALARLFWDMSDPAQATGYYSYIPEGVPVMRLHRFPNPATATRQVAVGLVLLRPDESPEDPGTPVTRTVTINRINPDLFASAVSAPSSATLGNPMSVTISERNLGTNPFAPVEAGWTGHVYLSTDAVLSPATDRLVDSYVESSAIAANQTIQKQRQPLVPNDLTPGTYYVIASLDASAAVLESNEGNNVAASGPVSIAPPVRACAIVEGTTTWRMTDQKLSTKATCTSAGTNIRYRWRTDANGAWTEYSSSSTLDFLGHATAGSHAVTLEVKDIATGATATDTRTITVLDNIITMTGPTFITTKGTYSYTASTSSYWWERFVPNTTWSGGIGPQTTWTRTWSAGCYEVDVRADASGGGVLKRARRHIVVAIGTGCEPPLL